MPLMIRLPRNEAVLRDTGPYRSGLNMLNRSETAVQRKLRRMGLAGFEPSTQAAILALVQLSPRPVRFFDIGAHVGLYSALVSAIYPPDVVQVTAFEPTPDTARICRQIAKRNRLPYHLEQVALADRVGTARLYVSSKAETSNSLAEGFRVAKDVIEVPLRTLDDYCLDTGIAPAVVKIDVETLEPAVLRGGLATFERARPWVVSEILPESQPEEVGDVLDRLERIGYQMHRLNKDGSLMTADAASVQRQASGESRNWLLGPGPISTELDAAMQAWMRAIAACTEESNIEVPAGTKPEPGWDESYRL